MAWDSTRTVPWRRLIREWLIYVAIASAGFVIYFLVKGDKIKATLFIGLISSGPMYVLFGALMAKFGYQRKTMKELRSTRPEPGTPRTSRSGRPVATADATVAGPRPRPAPTKRTSTGPSQHRKSTKPKRR